MDSFFKVCLLFALPPLIFYSGHGNLYDDAYEAGWQGDNMPLRAKLSNEARQAYKDGLSDGWMYDEGYDDGSNKRRMKYPNDESYVDGYRDGRENAY